MVGGYEGWRFYDLTKTGDGGKKGVSDEDGKGGWNEGFAIAPEWGTNCFPQASDFPATSNGEADPQKAFDAAAFESACKEYFHAAQELGRYILGMIAEGLGVETDFFEEYLDKQNSFCRLTHYYRPLKNGDQSQANGTSEEEPMEEGAAAHTDWGALTLLIQDTVGGLEVYDRSTGKWHEVTLNNLRY
jgi:isopenicillin N synthase-like dioxygenase